MTSTITKHVDNCSRVFRNYDMSCPRCKELAAGAQARDGWQKSYYEQQAQSRRMFEAGLKYHRYNHQTQKCNCGAVVCTWGES